jgi:hypothetical protein
MPCHAGHQANIGLASGGQSGKQRVQTLTKRLRAGQRLARRVWLTRSSPAQRRGRAFIHNSRPLTPNEKIAIVREAFSREDAGASPGRIDEVQTQTAAHQRNAINGNHRAWSSHAHQ